MWAALYKKVKGNDEEANYSPLIPMGTFKHYSQYNYNHGKWGVDKSTVLSGHVKLEGLKIIFESIYILWLSEGFLLIGGKSGSLMTS